MLYFMGYTDNEGNWTGNYTRAMRNELNKRHIEYVEIPPYDWYTANPPIDYYNSINSNKDDVWFFGWAQTPAMEILKDKPGKKYGIVVGATANPFEPANLWGTTDWCNERFRLDQYDTIFAVSDWCSRLLTKSYPELQGRVAVTGFPIDYSIYDPFKHIEKVDNLVIFNQRLTIEKLHVVEVELARRLVAKGFKVQHLSGTSREELSKQSTTLAALLNIMDNSGIEFIHNTVKETYHTNLAKASIAVTTSISDMLPNSMLEAIYLNLVPVAPRNLCFPEFIHSDNLYTPYDLDEMVEVIMKRPVRKHPIMRYSLECVVDKYLKYMNLI
ncbi:glycosyltransferase family 1 protein [Ruminiclostridium cellulolyticum]|uniref:Uncharacterized protein n=1 Tax=Ruminiclostridium cellulolyticum (strain ATCC 35319 / DSM 5812 / JCM 6584 / H10) TaxID=394503 RepID=B8I7M7_RUMCH|nr:glycosyltransferase family 1 protein [Ruminiclostridium cellulolyticum]ACL77098.1 hypothetical protein Ccel_2804 [Ruminiclostridium cellulolyticum H10]